MYAEYATWIDGMVTAFLDGAIAGGIAFALGYMRGALMVMVLVAGVLVWANKLDLWWLVRRVLIAMVVIALLRAQNYNEYIREPFWTTIPNGIASGIAGGAVRTTAAERFDRVDAQAAALVARADKEASLLNVRAGVALSLAQGAMKFFNFVCFAMWQIARMATAVLLAAGTYLLIAAVFDATRHFVLAWAGKLVSLAIWSLGSAALAEMLLAGVRRWVENANARGAVGLAELIDTVWGVAVVFGIAACTMVGLPAFMAIGGSGGSGVHAGAGLAGGAATGAAQMGRTAGRAAARAFNRARRS